MEKQDEVCGTPHGQIGAMRRKASIEVVKHSSTRSASDLKYWKERAVESRLSVTKEAIEQGDKRDSSSWISQYSPKVTHSGWLIKRGHNIHNFKRRLFFILDHELVYHDSHNSSDLCGRMDLRIDSRIQFIPHSGFKIVQGSYVMLLYAFDDLDRSIWVSKLSERGSITVDQRSAIDDTRCSELSSTKFSGWLRKRGRLVKSTKRRWFSMHGTILKYYVSPEDTNEKGSIDISKAKVGLLDTTKTGERYSFILQTPHRSTVLFADSNEIRSLWVTYIQSVSGEAITIPGSPLRDTKISITARDVLNDNSGALRDIRHEIKLILASPYSPEGSTSSNFIKQHANSNLHLSELRKFISGLYKFMWDTRVFELRLLGGETRDSTTLDEDISTIMCEEVEERVFYPLYKFVYNSINNKLKRESKALKEKILLLRSKSQNFFGIPREKISSSEWKDACTLMSSIDQFTLPYVKRARLVDTAKAVYNTFQEEHPDQLCMSADDFIPVFIFVLVHSHVEDLLCLKELLIALNCNDSQGEEAYFVTCLEIGIEYISSLMIACTVELDASIPFGIEFYSIPHEESIIVKKIVSNSQADRSGAIHVGDCLIAINGIKVNNMALSEVVTMVRSMSSTVELCFESPKQ